MQIRVACSCGQHYEFEVEPQNGAMPCNIVCPACGVDGTQAANEFIAEQSAPAPAPAPVAAPAAGGLRINRPAPPPPQPAAAEAPAPVAAPPPQKRYTRALEPDRIPPEAVANVPMGILGGLIAGSIAMVGWYMLTIATEREFGFVAWIVGVIVGIGVRIGAREGTPMLGYTASMCAALAILGGQFLAVNHIINKTFNEKFASLIENAGAEQKKMAQEGLNAKTDDEVKAWLVKFGELEKEPTQDDIKEFRESRVPELKAIMDAKPITRSIPFSLRFAMFKETVGVFTLIWLIFGVISAWRLGSGGS